MKDTSPLAENMLDSNRVSVELLITDARTANTLLDMAESTAIAEFRSRRIEEANKAYRSIVHFLSRLTPTPDQAKVLSAEMEKLSGRLKGANQQIDE